MTPRAILGIPLDYLFSGLPGKKKMPVPFYFPFYFSDNGAQSKPPTEPMAPPAPSPQESVPASSLSFCPHTPPAQN
jgi:hypothetical protein